MGTSSKHNLWYKSNILNFAIMKNIFLFFLVSIACVACDSFLNIEAKGAASEESLYNVEGAEKLVIAAYSSLGNDHWHEPYTSLWPYGNVRSEDAYKGGLGAADQGEYNTYENFIGITPQMDKANRIWTRLYIAIARTNGALNVLNELTVDEMPNKEERIAEMRFLRAHSHFILKILFKKIPYITDGLTIDEINEVSNNLPNNDLWNKNGEDFQFAIDNLSPTREEIRRPNKTVAQAYLAKVRLYQAYEQDEKNNVVKINQSLLEEVVTLVN